MFAQIIRFGGVGVVATLIHVLAALALQAAGLFPPLWANFGGFCAALLASYAGHSRITFRTDPDNVPQAIRFVTTALIGLLTSSSTVWLLNTRLGVSFTVAIAAVAVVVPALTYLIMRLWVFASPTVRQNRRLSDLALAAALAAVLPLSLWDGEVHHDVAWYLLATQKWLEGAALYIDVIEVNPPLAFYLTVPSLALAWLLGISAGNATMVFMALLIFASLSGCTALLRRHDDDELTPASWRIRLLQLAVLSLAMVLPSLPEIAQREQMLVIFMMPWGLSVCLPRPPPQKTRIAVAAFAALGICLKPHFLVYPLAITLLQICRERSLRPVFSAENLTITALGALYAGYVATMHPAYFNDIMPLAQQVYGGYGTSAARTVAGMKGDLLWFLPLMLLAFLPRPPLAGSGPARVFTTMALAAIAAYMAQSTGFAYQKIPLVAFTLCGLGWLMIANRKKPVMGYALLILLLSRITTIAMLGVYHNAHLPRIRAADIPWDRVQSYFALTPLLDVGPGVAWALELNWTSRYPASWLLPGAIKRLADLDCASDPAPCHTLNGIAARNRSDNITDIRIHRPDLLLIDRQPSFFGAPFDWEAFMDEDPQWQIVMASYRQVARDASFLYYLRTEAADMRGRDVSP